MFIPINCQSQASWLAFSVCQNWCLELHFKALSSRNEIHVFTELKLMPRHLWSLTGSLKKTTQPTNIKTQTKPHNFYKLQNLNFHTFTTYTQKSQQKQSYLFVCLFKEHQCNDFSNAGKLFFFFFPLKRSYVNLHIPRVIMCWRDTYLQYSAKAWYDCYKYWSCQRGCCTLERHGRVESDLL